MHTYGDCFFLTFFLFFVDIRSVDEKLYVLIDKTLKETA